MDYENKHKEEINRATQLWECGDITRENLEYIFPELKKSEDEWIEKIRKDIISYLNNRQIFSFAESSAAERWIAWIEKQGKQKSIDKVEPKFKVGDWIINKSHDICHITDDIDLENSYYICESIRFGNTEGDIDLTDKAFHLWTIQDAKQGDVLAVDSMPFIYNGSKNEVTVGAYCGFNAKHKFSFAYNYVINQNITPATKEQRDLLFEKIGEEGYEWDEEKKELKKIEKQGEQKPKWTEEGIREAQLDYWRSVAGKEWHGVPVQETIAWLEKQGEQKSAWSEEDECYMSECIGAIATKDGWSFEEKRKTKHWLKSLKERYTWKPSDEQIEAIKLARSFVVDDFSDHPTLSEILMELEEQLNKLCKE